MEIAVRRASDHEEQRTKYIKNSILVNVYLEVTDSHNKTYKLEKKSYYLVCLIFENDTLSFINNYKEQSSVYINIDGKC